MTNSFSMRTILRTSLVCLFSFGVFSGMSQRFGGNRPGIKWNQIRNDTARIIFPAGLETQAAEIASLIRLLAKETSGTIGEEVRQIPIVLQYSPVVSNGYVGLAPFRSEFYMNPPAGSYNLGTLPWHLQLAAHEYRHVQQYNNFNKGMSKLGRIVLGEEGQALMNAASVPDWFFEGDAVFQETAESGQGRGRIPYFFNEFKVLKEGDVVFNYMQLRNGSYRNLYPGHYELGYLLVGYGYEKYGADFWRKVTDDAARFKGLFYSLQKAVKKHAGIPFKNFVQDALKYYNQQFEEKRTGIKRARYVSNWTNPHPTAQGVLWHKSSYRDIPAFHLKTSEGSGKIVTRQIGTDDYFSERNGKLVYTRYSVHPRWTWTEYSDVVLLDMASRKEKRITKRQRLFSPDINASGTNIVAVENNTVGKSTLVLLDSTGTITRRFDFPLHLLKNMSGNGVFTYPKFDGDTALVTVLRFPNGMNALATVQLSSGNFRLLTPASFQVIGIPNVTAQYIYGNAALRDEDRLIRIDKHTSATTFYAGVTRAYAPAITADSIVFGKFTLNGTLPGSVKNTEGNWQPVEPAEWSTTPLYLPNTLKQGQDITRAARDSFQVYPYKKSHRFINIHSWRPFIEASELSFSVYGQNVLNTFQSETYYRYNINEGSHAVGAAGVFGGWFPYIRAGVDYNMDRNVLVSGRRRLAWNELTANVGAQVPLQFNSGRFYRTLSMATSFNNRSILFKGLAKDTMQNRKFNFLRGTISYSAQIQQATQHIFPRFAYSFSADFQSIINNYTGRQLLLTAGLYLPGLHKTHNLVLTGAIHRRDSANDYRFSNRFPHARGFTSENLYKMQKAAVNYHFPLAYPDWGFGNIVYLMRLRANVFYDHSRIADNFRLSNNQVRYLEFDQRSTGVEIYFDTKWWNQLPVSFGLRYSRLLDDDIFGRSPNQYEFILPVNLF